MDKPSHIIRMTTAVSYQILVQGDLDPRWSGRLGGLDITSSVPELGAQSPKPGASVTQLSGRLVDQAALFGVLNTLYQLRLPLISIITSDVDVDEGGCE